MEYRTQADLDAVLEWLQAEAQRLDPYLAITSGNRSGSSTNRPPPPFTPKSQPHEAKKAAIEQAKVQPKPQQYLSALQGHHHPRLLRNKWRHSHQRGPQRRSLKHHQSSEKPGVQGVHRICQHEILEQAHGTELLLRRQQSLRGRLQRAEGSPDQRLRKPLQPRQKPTRRQQRCQLLGLVR